jgi:hypothetical protein
MRRSMASCAPPQPLPAHRTLKILTVRHRAPIG